MSKKKSDILKTATLLFAHKGFRQTSMAELSRLSEAAEGTIFYYFKSKENLLVIVLETARNAIIDAFKNGMSDQTSLSGIDRVEALLSFYLDLTEHMQEAFLILHRHFPYEKAEANSLCREYLASIYSCVLDHLEAALIKGREDGTVTAAANSNTAMILFSLVDGISRFNTMRIYNTGALYTDLMQMCRNMLTFRNG
jgi:AcrR family transcriptional regulator